MRLWQKEQQASEAKKWVNLIKQQKGWRQKKKC